MHLEIKRFSPIQYLYADFVIRAISIDADKKIQMLTFLLDIDRKLFWKAVVRSIETYKCLRKYHAGLLCFFQQEFWKGQL